MKKEMFALTYCYEGVDNNIPYACTIAVSEDIEKLRAEMEKCIEEDTREPNEEDGENEWQDDINYQVFKKCGDDVVLQHKKNINLYASYKIHRVNVL